MNAIKTERAQRLNLDDQNFYWTEINHNILNVSLQLGFANGYILGLCIWIGMLITIGIYIYWIELIPNMLGIFILTLGFSNNRTES